MRILYTGPSGVAGEFVTESESVLLGRLLPPGPGHLSLNDGKISGRHARFTLEGGELWIEDLGSTNGTWVERKKIKSKTRLKAGATVRVGETTLQVEAVAGESPAPSDACPELSVKEEPVKEPPIEVVEANQPLPDLFLAGASLEAAKLRLSAVYDLSTALSEIDSVEALASALLDRLHQAFPRVGRRGHSGLLMGPNLILKAFRPEDRPPSCSLTLARHVLAQKKACLWQIDAPGEIDTSASLLQIGAQSAMYAPLIWKGEVLGVLYLDTESPKAFFDLDDLRLLQVIATQAAMFIKNLLLQQTMQREAIVRSRLLAQFPRQIAERLARQPGQMAVISERVESVTVLFSDVRGFTKLTSLMEPDHVVQMLNDMFHDLTPIILKHNGTVDKYVGDAILAVFGSPEADEHQYEHAVQAALEMQAAVKSLAAGRWQGRSPFEIGIGIHTGPAIHGFIGAPERMEYTVIGGTINAASRYCAAAGPHEILISPETYARLHHCLEVAHPPREFETKHEGKLRAYVVLGWRQKPATQS